MDCRQKQSIQIAVHATHSGGVCQFGLSYDKGKTIKTIQTTKNCLIAAQEPADKFGDSEITQTFSVQLPADIPSGTALFSWSWFNTVGNREMYNSCSKVTINGGTVRTMPKTYKDIVILNVPNMEPTKKCVSIQGTVPDLTRLTTQLRTQKQRYFLFIQWFIITKTVSVEDNQMLFPLTSLLFIVSAES